MPARGAARRRRRSTSPLAGDAAYLALEACHDALVRIEEARLDLAPATESELVDRELPGANRELLAILVQDALHDGPVAVVGEDLLRCRRSQEAQELVRLVLVLARLQDGDRVLDEDRLLRDDELQVLTLRSREERLVLVREEDVALAAHEGVERVAGARVLDGDALEELQGVCLRLLVGLSLLAPRAVGGHDVPAGA